MVTICFATFFFFFLIYLTFLSSQDDLHVYEVINLEIRNMRNTENLLCYLIGLFLYVLLLRIAIPFHGWNMWISLFIPMPLIYLLDDLNCYVFLSFLFWYYIVIRLCLRICYHPDCSGVELFYIKRLSINSIGIKGCTRLFTIFSQSSVFEPVRWNSPRIPILS